MNLTEAQLLALHKNNSRALKFAQIIHQENKPELLIVLADMLEEAGWENQNEGADEGFVTHCRIPIRDHTGGNIGPCWQLTKLLREVGVIAYER